MNKNNKKELHIDKRVYPANDKVLNFKFVQNDVDFIVEEQPIKFSSYGTS